MQITKTLHPPGGATALIAIIGSDKIKDLGYLYVVFSCVNWRFDFTSYGFSFQQYDFQQKYPTQVPYQKASYKIKNDLYIRINKKQELTTFCLHKILSTNRNLKSKI